MIALDNVMFAEVRPHEMFRSLTAEARSSIRGSLFDVLQRTIGDLRVGEAVYHTRSPLLATFYPRIRGVNGELVMTPTSLNIVGVGKNFDEALRDWNNQFHIRFQTLLAKRPWELSAEEKDEWGQLELLVDVAAYRRETPYVIRQIGMLTRRRPFPDQIRWEDGRQERVWLEQMPPEFAALHEGQRFEAEVVRDAVTGRMIRAIVVRRLPALRTMAADLANWVDIPTTDEAKEVDWNEFE
ncbi:MAG: hypothetical protein U0798_17620 [Gemmataceae bacterium]